ncbi:MAG TPA: hypothetical protein VF598_08975 [Hymenobacter sp.]
MTAFAFADVHNQPLGLLLIHLEPITLSASDNKRLLTSSTTC